MDKQKTISTMTMDALNVVKIYYTDECTKDRNNPIKCVFCNKNDIVNFKGCLIFKLAHKKTVSKFAQVKNPDLQTQPRTKSYARVTNSQTINTEYISSTFSNLISILNS